jgi:hypothetical protein
MRLSPAIVGVLAWLLASFGAVFLSSDCWAADQVLTWRAMPHLDLPRSGTNCVTQGAEPIGVTFDGKSVKTSGWSRMTYDMEFLAPLNADGSGEVYALSMPLHRDVVVKFEAGTGPRPFTYWIRYNARCVWKFLSVAD